ncbi:hypothetical protein ACXWO4_10860, partial [Streptococcus pyogenes]
GGRSVGAEEAAREGFGDSLLRKAQRRRQRQEAQRFDANVLFPRFPTFFLGREKPKELQLVNPQRGNNVAIMLSRFKLPYT